ncbi:SDR family oxidoreductase [Bacillus sp. mrc49]|uniref:SDR family oxidoreductase n=1 Tax=Bacillus sp. mrc49 TaxID=2054913 RepID=UPI000C273539|nr:SDR family oxidoreductase [Bacillus sp. mrc49]PJN87640.1 NAD(P)-dependent oxidoreductase [Bacillus sp. mrc49]
MILITGSTGNVGKEVVRELQSEGIPFVTASHRSGHGDRYLNFEDASSFTGALQGIDSVFLMRPPHLADVNKYFRPFIEEAVKQNVKHIVFLSVLGADKNKIVPHAKIEKVILESNIPYTFLRPSFFMQNLLTEHGEELREKHEIYVPAGKGKTSFIDVRDIGVAAMKTLIHEEHRGKAYDLTGNEALSYQEVAEIFSEITGESFTYSNPSILEFWKTYRKKGMSNDKIVVMVGIYTTAKIGFAKRVTKDLHAILGHAPITVEQFVKDSIDILK